MPIIRSKPLDQAPVRSYLSYMHGTAQREPAISMWLLHGICDSRCGATWCGRSALSHGTVTSIYAMGCCGKWKGRHGDYAVRWWSLRVLEILRWNAVCHDTPW